ncbi:LysR family transcriptional regulator [Rubellimicrobium roseum]|uniref:LysR family transcriptional regulator n=1 Tax=Rubellimicrobium roseum TaxID=687525 RepID=A0A5C4NGW1_9RHOB|nr:LysR family transcriptional regulator [Rubellimicrobium roseum]TNC73105.1 LysR family transcriptional regulator [Rubellimicrobium roseum]
MVERDIRRLDFTLLLVLASLLRTRKSTATAGELHMTQSTVSHALGRLRDLLGDPLFLRRPHGLEPTARALALAPALDEILGLAGGLFAASRFDPATAEGTLRIAGADYHCALMAAPLIARLGQEAPGLRMVFRPHLRDRAVEALVAGEIDLAVGRFFALPSTVRRHPLFEENYSLVARADHPLVQGTPDLDAFVAARHIVVSLDGEPSGVVDKALAALGRERRVVAAVPYFLTALAAVAASDAVVTLPSRLARVHAAAFGLTVLRPPVELPSFPVSAVLPAAVGPSSAAHWMVETVLPDLA